MSMQVISADEFLSADDLPLVPVNLPPAYGEGRGVFIRSMVGRERSALEKRFSGRNPSDAPGEFRCAMLLATVVDENGEPVFKEEHRKDLMGKNAQTLELMFEAACEVNGFTQKDVEESAKN